MIWQICSNRPGKKCPNAFCANFGGASLTGVLRCCPPNESFHWSEACANLRASNWGSTFEKCTLIFCQFSSQEYTVGGTKTRGRGHLGSDVGRHLVILETNRSKYLIRSGRKHIHPMWHPSILYFTKGALNGSPAYISIVPLRPIRGETISFWKIAIMKCIQLWTISGLV